MALAFSFSGCGLLAGYHIGAWSRLARETTLNPHRAPLIGCSGGALVAGALAAGVSVNDAAAAMQNIVDGVRAAGFGGILRTDLLRLVRSELKRVLPADAHAQCSGRLAVCVTDASGLRGWRRPTAVLHSHWSTRTALLDSLLSSSYIPLVTSRGFGHPAAEAGSSTPLLLDGGLSGNNFPLHPTAERTVRISPFAGDVDICPPSDPLAPPRRVLLPAGVRVDVSRANAHAVWRAAFPCPHDGDSTQSQLASGYDDACRWLRAQP